MVELSFDVDVTFPVKAYPSVVEGGHHKSWGEANKRLTHVRVPITMTGAADVCEDADRDEARAAVVAASWSGGVDIAELAGVIEDEVWASGIEDLFGPEDEAYVRLVFEGEPEFGELVEWDDGSCYLLYDYFSTEELNGLGHVLATDCAFSYPYEYPEVMYYDALEQEAFEGEPTFMGSRDAIQGADFHAY